MSYFYGKIDKSSRRTVSTACGTKNSGMGVVAAGWAGAIYTELWHDKQTGKDMYTVHQGTWQGAGVHQELARGVLGETNGK